MDSYRQPLDWQRLYSKRQVGEDIDPDPFAIAFGILGVVFAGGAYLEQRRQREIHEEQARTEFRRAWYESRRTLIHARRVVEEFATYVSEDRLGTVEFLFGKVRLTLERGRANQLRRLHGNAHVTAQNLADNLDAISDFLGQEYNPQVEAIHSLLASVTGFPENYRATVRLARSALDVYEDLIEAIGERERFESEDLTT
jgi:hypothetical protein